MNNNKQQTAVDIAFEKLANQGLLVTRDYKNLVVYREAKEMEKEQIIDAHLTGLIYPLEMEATKQETLEEAAERFYPISKGGSMWMPSAHDCNQANKQEGFIEGAKWQKERSYSEEEALKLLNKYNEYLFTFIDKDVIGIGVEEEDVVKWFEQFKKK